jgi:hypothetical protein
MARRQITSFETELSFSREATDVLLAASSEFRKVLRQRAVAIAKAPDSGAEKIRRGETETLTVGPDQVRQALDEMGLDFLV